MRASDVSLAQALKLLYTEEAMREASHMLRSCCKDEGFNQGLTQCKSYNVAGHHRRDPKLPAPKPSGRINAAVLDERHIEEDDGHAGISKHAELERRLHGRLIKAGECLPGVHRLQEQRASLSGTNTGASGSPHT